LPPQNTLKAEPPNPSEGGLIKTPFRG